MPTGGGKSICFQIPAITLPGVCIVVSPLIALMKDQVEGLKANGIRAAFLNSSQIYGEQRLVEDELFYGKIDICYVSPEKLLSTSFIPLLKRLNVNLFAIDEAHCISSWGHDFRPEYTQMEYLKREFPEAPVIALTATADKVTRRDIIKQLRLNNPGIFIASFDRPNLKLTVRPGQQKFQQLYSFILQRPDQAGIIYCLSRKNTETVATKLQAKGISAAYYHAGMSSRERSRIQEDFINDRTPIICATIAFGMGIDKSNIRWVIHYNMPRNIESYYQEIGRSGRDGLKADTLLFYSYQDVIIYKDILDREDSSLKQVKLAKLNRMYQYATALICRRKILLNYFSEHQKTNCGNCDICKNPPSYIDGTIVAQKALSAITRLKESVAMGMLIDVLRGSGRRDIFLNGYHTIKTYGAGRDLSIKEWRYYLEQMLNLGLIEVALDDYNKVKLTPASKGVLFKGQKVRLVDAQTAFQKQKTAKKTKVKPISQKQLLAEELFQQLHLLRRSLAQQQGTPPYLIFSDATLEDMAKKMPSTEADMRLVSGMGEIKLQNYGAAFLNTIQDFIVKKVTEGATIKGSTYIFTYRLYLQNMGILEMAEQRGIKTMTIYSHLAYLYEKGENIDIERFVNPAEMEQILAVLPNLKEDYTLRDIYEALNEQMSYYKIKFALAHQRKMRAMV